VDTRNSFVANDEPWRAKSGTANFRHVDPAAFVTNDDSGTGSDLNLCVVIGAVQNQFGAGPAVVLHMAQRPGEEIPLKFALVAPEANGSVTSSLELTFTAVSGCTSRLHKRSRFVIEYLDRKSKLKFG
jgi:hypothetical protein